MHSYGYHPFLYFKGDDRDDGNGNWYEKLLFKSEES